MSNELSNGRTDGMIYDPTAPAGWYDDHALPLLQRYWNGWEWAEDVRPKIPAGWYVDPEDRKWDRYWDGTEWLANWRPNHVGSLTLGGGGVQGAVAVIGFLFMVPVMAITGFVGLMMIFGGEIAFGVALLTFAALFTTLFIWFNLKRLRYSRQAIAAQNTTSESQAAVESDAIRALPPDMRGEKRWAPPYLIGMIAALSGLLSFMAMSDRAIIPALFMISFTVVVAWAAWHTYRLNRKAGLPVEEAWKTSGKKQ